MTTRKVSRPAPKAQSAPKVNVKKGAVPVAAPSPVAVVRKITHTRAKIASAIKALAQHIDPMMMRFLIIQVKLGALMRLKALSAKKNKNRADQLYNPISAFSVATPLAAYAQAEIEGVGLAEDREARSLAREISYELNELVIDCQAYGCSPEVAAILKATTATIRF